jgi:hypothetical protein
MPKLQSPLVIHLVNHDKVMQSEKIRLTKTFQQAFSHMDKDIAPK